MSKAKTIARRPVAELEEEPLDLPAAWRKRPWVPFLILGVVVAAVIGSGLAVDQALQQPRSSVLANCKTSTAVGVHSFLAPQPICIVPNKSYQAVLNTTQGLVVIQLHPEIAPITVNNFVVLALNGYYNNVVFWDSQDWEVQTGDPKGNGRGGPGYNLPPESSKDKWGLGAVGMARIPGGPINGSQFFILKAAWPGSGPTAVYNRFGTVISGMDKVQVITTTDRINSIAIKVT